MKKTPNCFNEAGSERKVYERTIVKILSLAERDFVCTSGEENPEAGGEWIFKWN